MFHRNATFPPNLPTATASDHLQKQTHVHVYTVEHNNNNAQISCVASM